MSYSIFYNSFNKDAADKNWKRFDVLINNVIEKRKKISEQEECFDEYDIDEELIYNPDFKVEYEKKRLEIINAGNNFKKIKEENYLSEVAILYYIEKQEPIESDIIIELMIDLDLLFGGKRASYSSALDPISQIETTLKIIFPELNLGESGWFREKDLTTLFKNLDKLDARFDIHEKELLENKELDVLTESNLSQWKKELKAYLLKLHPIVKEVLINNAYFFTWTDSEGYPDNSLLKERAKKHSREFRDHYLLKVPLQKYKE